PAPHPPFPHPAPGQTRRPAAADVPAPLTPAAADCRLVELAPGRRLRTRLAGLFLSLPLLAKLDWPRLVEEAAYPDSARMPAGSALPALLALKLIDEGRRGHSDDLDFDEAAGLFRGLDVPPKKSFMTEYSYRTGRDNQRRLPSGWGRRLPGL